MTYAELRATLLARADLANASDDAAAAAMQEEFPGISGGDIYWARACDDDGQLPDQKLRQAAAEKLDADWVRARDAAKVDGNRTITREDFERAAKGK